MPEALKGVMSYNELRKLAYAGVIDGVKPEHINSASIDVTLGNKILFEKSPSTEHGVAPHFYADLCQRTPLQMNERVLKEGECWELLPGEFILTHTRERFFLPNWLSAEYKLKSSMARMGLEHLNAGWCDAGWNGSVLTLELKNMTNHHIICLRPGDKIGQMIFYAHDVVPHSASYATKGSYNNHGTVTGAKPEKTNDPA